MRISDARKRITKHGRYANHYCLICKRYWQWERAVLLWEDSVRRGDPLEEQERRYHVAIRCKKRLLAL